MLPADLWAEVFSHLDVDELLQARLVSRNFVLFSDIQLLSMEWRLMDASAIGSLMLFVSRHFTAPSSPQLDVYIGPLC